jgi:hypothetical protein
MSEVTATPPARKPRAKRIPSLGFETKSITIDLPLDMHKKFEAAALKDRLPLKMYLVRELDGLNAIVVNVQAPAAVE